MPAVSLVRRGAALLVLAVLTVAAAGCSSERVAPSGSSPLAPPSTAPPPTEATTTTQAPTAATPLIRQAVLDYWTAQRTCQQRPQACKPATFTADQGTARADVQSAVATLLSNSWYRAKGSENDASADGGYVAVGAVTIDPDGATATADECVYDPAPLMGPGGVVSAVAVAHRIVHTLYLEDDEWKVGDETIDPSGVCDATPDPVAADVTDPTTT
jgi:hypothetical protein